MSQMRREGRRASP